MKRAWIIVICAAALAVIISACGQDELAPNLTPIPTLPAGEEPALNEALIAGNAAAEPGGDELVAVGEALFGEDCAGCHGESDGTGPAFPGMAERAETRVEGMSAEEYLHESIVDPSAHVVEGYNDIMPKIYDEQYSDEEIDGLVAYIMAESGDGEDDGEATSEEASESTDEDEAESSEATSTAVDGDPAAGETLFAASCAGCHQATDGAGPALTGMGERAEDRIEGMTAVEYLHESIVDPHAFIVEGFRDNVMPDNYDERFSDEEIDDLIAYMLTQ